MNRLIALLVVFGIAGCVTFNKGDRKRGATVIEQRELATKAKLHIPKIRKPRILKAKEIMSNKDEQGVDGFDSTHSSKTIEEALKIPMTSDEINKVEGELPTAQSNKNLSEAERNKRFDNLMKTEKEDVQIKEDNPSRLDVATIWIGAIGICAVFWAGVYYVARNLF